MASIGIIGAGIGALSVAPLLQKAGHTVTVYEKNSWPGGRAFVYTRGGYSFDMGPSWLTMPYIFEDWFRSIGENLSEYVTLKPLDPSYQIVWSDKSLSVPRNFEELQTLVAELEPEGKKKLLEYYHFAERIFEVSNTLVLNRSFKGVLDYMSLETFLPFLKARIPLFGNLEHEINKRFSNPKVRQMLQYHLAFFGTSPKTTAPVFATMNYADMKWGVSYPMGGMGEVMKAMKLAGEKLGVKYVFNQDVTQIVESNKKITGLKVGDAIHHHDIIISNAHREFTEKTLLNRSFRSTPLAPSAVLIIAGLSKKLENAEHHNLFFSDNFEGYYKEIFDQKVTPTDPNFYLSVASHTDPTIAPDGCENLSWVIPVSSYAPFTTTELNAFAQKIIKITEQKLQVSITPFIEFMEVRAHEYFESTYHAPLGTALGIPNLLRYSGALRPPQQDKQIDNLYYVGADTHPGIGMPMAILSGQNLATLINKKYPKVIKA